MRLIVQQKVKHEQLMAKGGYPQEIANVTEFTAYQPYTQVVLVYLGTQFQQKQGGTPGNKAFVTLGHRVGWYPVFWG